MFVGNIPIDAGTLLLHPAKHDWAAHHQLGLAEVWAGVESAVFARHMRTSHARTGAHVDMRHLLESARPPPPHRHHARRDRTHHDVATEELFYFLPLAQLAQSCPFTRCDGLHFASDYSAFQCRSTMAVWHGFLSRFFNQTGLLRSAQERRTRCLALKEQRKTLPPRGSALSICAQHVQMINTVKNYSTQTV